MNAIISSEELSLEMLMGKLKEIPNMAGLELSSRVATSEAYDVFPRLRRHPFVLHFWILG